MVSSILDGIDADRTDALTSPTRDAAVMVNTRSEWREQVDRRENRAEGTEVPAPKALDGQRRCGEQHSDTNR